VAASACCAEPEVSEQATMADETISVTASATGAFRERTGIGNDLGSGCQGAE